MKDGIRLLLLAGVFLVTSLAAATAALYFQSLHSWLRDLYVWFSVVAISSGCCFGFASVDACVSWSDR